MMDPVIKEMQEAVLNQAGRVTVAFAFNMSQQTDGLEGTMYGVQVTLGTRKVGPMLFPQEGTPATPANALRALADLMEAER